MVPGATVTGRLVDADGKPRAGVELEMWFHRKEQRASHPFASEPIRTDHDGRFCIEALIPGYEFQLRAGKGSVQFGDGLRSGEIKELGDVRVKP